MIIRTNGFFSYYIGRGSKHIENYLRKTYSTKDSIEFIDFSVRINQYALKYPTALTPNIVRKFPIKVLEYNKSSLQYVESIKSPTLRPYQVEAARTFLEDKHKMLLHADTGAGKTLIMCDIINNLPKGILILNHRLTLINQLTEKVKEYCPDRKIELVNNVEDWDNIDIVIGTGISCFPRQNHLIGRIQSVILDEAHHASAAYTMGTIIALDPEYLLGLTATPFKSHKRMNKNWTSSDIDDLIVRIIFQNYYRVTIPKDIEKKIFAEKNILIVDYPVDTSLHAHPKMSYTKSLEKLILTNPNRLDAIYSLIDTLNKNNVKTLVYADYIDKGVLPVLAELGNMGIESRAYTGQGTYYLNHELKTIDCDKKGTVKDIPEFIKDHNIVLSTSVLSEGIDIPDLACLIVLSAGKSPINVIQRIGRVLRRKSDNRCLIIDFNDYKGYSPSDGDWSYWKGIFQLQFQKRKKIYDSLNNIKYIDSIEDFLK